MYTITHLKAGGPDSLIATLQDEQGKLYHGITLWKDNWHDLEEGSKVDGTLNFRTLRPLRSVGYAYKQN